MLSMTANALKKKVEMENPPWVVVSPLVPARGTTPLSTLMPTTMPLSLMS